MLYKGKGSFYIAQYPVRWTAQSALHFLPPLADLFIPTPTRLLREVVILLLFVNLYNLLISIIKPVHSEQRCYSTRPGYVAIRTAETVSIKKSNYIYWHRSSLHDKFYCVRFNHITVIDTVLLVLLFIL